MTRNLIWAYSYAVFVVVVVVVVIVVLVETLKLFPMMTTIEIYKFTSISLILEPLSQSRECLRGSKNTEFIFACGSIERWVLLCNAMFYI